MKRKDGASEKTKEFVAEAETQHPENKVMRTRMDGGGEYAGEKSLLQWLREKDIKRKVTTPYSPQ